VSFFPKFFIFILISCLQLVDAQFRILVLHERIEGKSKDKDRKFKDDEKPWLILQKPGQRIELVVHPLTTPLSIKMSYMDHFMSLLSLLMPKTRLIRFVFVSLNGIE
jgi:hypothetical protein